MFFGSLSVSTYDIVPLFGTRSALRHDVETDAYLARFVSMPSRRTDSVAWVDAPTLLANAETIPRHGDDDVAMLTLNRPEARNTINDVMAHDTLRAAHAIESDPSVRAVLI